MHYPLRVWAAAVRIPIPDSAALLHNCDAVLGWEAGIRTPIMWSKERCTGFCGLPFARFCYGFLDRPFGLLRSVSRRSCAICLFVSHPDVESPRSVNPCEWGECDASMLPWERLRIGFR